MKKKKLYEAQKNYLVCAVIMILVGILMLYMKRPSMGIGIIAFGVLFAIGFFVLIAKDGMIEILVEQEDAAVSEIPVQEEQIIPEDASAVMTSYAEQENENKAESDIKEMSEVPEAADAEETEETAEMTRKEENTEDVFEENQNVEQEHVNVLEDEDNAEANKETD